MQSKKENPYQFAGMKAWAYRLKDRHESRERLSHVQIRFHKEALMTEFGLTMKDVMSPNSIAAILESRKAEK
jgi:hypothetical protein